MDFVPFLWGKEEDVNNRGVQEYFFAHTVQLNLPKYASQAQTLTLSVGKDSERLITSPHVALSRSWKKYVNLP